MKRALITVGLALCITASFGCHRRGGGGALQDTNASPTAVVVATAELSRTPEFTSLAGVTEPAKRVTLASRLAARVLALRVQEGDRVGVSAPLVELDVRDLRAKRRQLSASRESAAAQARWSDRELARTATLSQSGALPSAALDEVTRVHAASGAALAGIDAQFLELDTNLSDATIRAPFSGVVVRKLGEVGFFAAPGQPLLVLEDDSSLRLSVAVSDLEAASLQVGATVPVSVGESPAVAGTVRAIVSSGDSFTPGSRLIVSIENSQHALRAGMVARVALPATHDARRIVEVPPTATQYRGALAGVWVVRDDRLTFAWVKIVDSTATATRISAGVDPGDRVARNGADPGLRDGLRVVVTP